MSLLTALGYYMGGRNQAKEQGYQNDLAERQLNVEQQRAAEQAKIDQANLDVINRQNQQSEANRKFETGLQLPPHWGNMHDNDKIGYLQQRLNAAQRAGDDNVVKQTQDAINSIALGTERLSTADVNRQGRIPLMQAQAQHFRQLHGEFEQKLQQAWKIADAATRARIYNAQQSANARLASAQMSNDEKQYIATLTALNVANRMDSTQAFQAAMAQYHSAAQQYQAQEKQYNLGLAPDPGAAPTPQQFIINTPQQQQPGVTMVNITLQDGRQIKVPVVNPKGGASSNGAAPAGGDDKSQFAKFFAITAKQLNSGIPMATIRQQLEEAVQHGKMSESVRRQILQRAGIPLTPSTNGGGFGQP